MFIINTKFSVDNMNKKSYSIFFKKERRRTKGERKREGERRRMKYLNQGNNRKRGKKIINYMKCKSFEKIFSDDRIAG